MITHKNTPFGFSPMYDMDVKRSNVDFSNEYSIFFEKKLQIADYTDKLKEICLIYMAIDPTSHSYRPNRKFWRWKSGIFDMYVNVPDYQKYCNATRKEAKKIIAELFLESIKKYLWKRKDFDAPKFYTDVERVLKSILDS